jgi:two-component system response regulator FixJ
MQKSMPPPDHPLDWHLGALCAALLAPMLTPGVEKPYAGATILKAVEAAFGRGDEEKSWVRKVADAAARIATLARRETEVLLGLVAGRQNKVIAHDLGLSSRTVEIHRANAMARLGDGSISEAVRIAQAAGLRPPGEGANP